MAQDPAINSFVAEMARRAMAPGKRVPDLQLPDVETGLDENKFYASPMDTYGPVAPLPSERFRYKEVTGVGNVPPSIEMSWRHKREPEGAVKSDVGASKDAPSTAKAATVTPVSAKMPPSAGATGGAKKDTSPAAAGDTPNQDASGPDALLEHYKSQSGDLNSLRDAALAKAKSQEDLTDNEKIGLALISVLPALVGGVAGSAFGGAGAAAGAAGGLQGAAAGWQQVQGAKNEKRKEAKEEADKLDAQKWQLGLLGDKRQETLEERGIRKGEIGQKNKLEREKMAQDARIAGNHDATQIGISKMNNATDYQKAILNYKGDQLRAQAAVGGAGKALKEDDKSFYDNTAGLLRNLDELETLIGKTGNYESDTVLSSDEAAKNAGRLNQLFYDSAIKYAKVSDPATAAREGEVESAKKYAIPAGLLTSNAATLEAIRHMKQAAVEKALTRNELGVPLSPEVVDFMRRSEQPKAGSGGAINQQKPVDLDAKWGLKK